MDEKIAALTPFPAEGSDYYDLSTLDLEVSAYSDRLMLAIDMIRELSVYVSDENQRKRVLLVLEACKDAE